ncbi:hypothetical protein BAE44_0003319 [Dichanthelium oligosanthes]|uniref:No apical meristem-associated C-terminal domain-containing protein n=1 Tax=Dichanthelium oligosanthes TaxID=888268 RepID=A0A1E5WE33_9POAL|nr:hypothetical protein BAE44_0003319 [Dichanthelium oligosanthes]
MLSDETDVDALNLSMPLDNIAAPASGGKVSTKRSRNFTQKEDIQLCMSWQNISTDPIVANEQPGKSYWKRIAEHFHAHRTLSLIGVQTHLSIVGLVEAQTMFTNKDPKDRSFQFLHCWLKVRNCPKLQAIEQSHKRPRSTKSSMPCEVGATEEEGDETGKSETPDSAQASQHVRPIGRKEAKKRLKTGGDAGPYKENIEPLAEPPVWRAVALAIPAPPVPPPHGCCLQVYNLLLSADCTIEGVCRPVN